MQTIQPPTKTPPSFSVQSQENRLVFSLQRRNGYSSRVLPIIFASFPFVILTIATRNACIRGPVFSIASIWDNCSFLVVIGPILLLFILALFWILQYKEIVEVDSTGIQVTSFPILGTRRTNKFLSKDIHNLRVFQDLKYASNPQSAGGHMIVGPLGFRYGGGIYYFGMGIPREEAEEVLTLIREKFPNYTMP